MMAPSETVWLCNLNRIDLKRSLRYMTNCGPYGSNAHSFGTTQYAERSLFTLDMKDFFIEAFFTVLFTALLVIGFRFVSSMMCSSWYSKHP